MDRDEYYQILIDRGDFDDIAEKLMNPGPGNPTLGHDAAYLITKYRAEIGRLQKRVTDLESLAHEAEDILGEVDADDGPLDIGDWRCWYRELGLLQTKGTDDSDEHFPWCQHAQNMARPRSQQLIGPKCTCAAERRHTKEFREWLDSDAGQEAIRKACEQSEKGNE